MKHIKSYNDVEIEEIMQNCKDILLDLKDDSNDFGYVVYKRFLFRTPDSSPEKITISIQNDNEFFIEDIKDVIERLNRYMKSINWIELSCSGVEIGEDPETLEYFYYCELVFEDNV